METLQPASQAELELMKIIWQSDNKTTLGVLMKHPYAINKQWKVNTVVTFLARLTEKGMLTVEKNGRNNIYIAAMTEAEFRKQQTQSFIKKIYDGNARELIASLLKQERLTPKDIEELTEFWEKGGDVNE